jgi:predicted nucleic acid-binding protein
VSELPVSELPGGSASAYLIDAGPLVSLLNRRDVHHKWARLALAELDAPLLTCEAVVSEAWFLVKRDGGRPEHVLDLLAALEVRVVAGWGERADELLRRYSERGSVADASLLALAEQKRGRVVVTTDRKDFSVYRIHRNQSVPVLMPPL